MRKIVVTDYDPGWITAFAAIRNHLWPAIHDLTQSIEHVGSTAIPGLAAKPIIDIDIVVGSNETVAPVVARLEPLGYTHLGDLGIAGRDALRQNNSLPRHNLYVCVADSLALRNHLALRSYLQTHPEAVRAYGDLKRQLAEKFPNDMPRYVAGKTELIVTLLGKAGISPVEVAEIQKANQVP